MEQKDIEKLYEKLKEHNDLLKNINKIDQEIQTILEQSDFCNLSSLLIYNSLEPVKSSKELKGKNGEKNEWIESWNDKYNEESFEGYHYFRLGDKKYFKLRFVG